jgi:hypothetical protein
MYSEDFSASKHCAMAQQLLTCLSQWGEGQVLLHERKFSPVSIIPLVLRTELRF